MSYALCSEDGYQRDIASVNGYFNLVKFCMEVGGPVLRDFVVDGQSQAIYQLKKDIADVLPKVSDNDVKSSLLELQKGLQGVKEIAIITDYT